MVVDQTLPEVRPGFTLGLSVSHCEDLGVHGVLLPLIRTADDLRLGFGFARYPKAGMRGIGLDRAVRWGLALESYVKVADEETLVIPIIETAEASANIGEILAVPGVEAIFFGPADFSSSAGYRGQWEGPGIAERILQMKDTIRNAGKNCGVVSTSVDNLKERRDQGFRMIALGLDTTLFMRALLETLTAVGRPM